MRFTLGRLFVLTGFVAFIAANVFIFPSNLAAIILFFLATIVFPPFVWIGVIQSRGSQQAFFIGAMVSGIPHFVFSAYFVCTILFFSGLRLDELEIVELWNGLFQSDVGMERGVLYVHGIGIILGCIGGLSGMLARRMFVSPIENKLG